MMYVLIKWMIVINSYYILFILSFFQRSVSLFLLTFDVYEFTLIVN